MSIAQGFVLAMHGRFELDDTPGGGLTVIIAIPLAGWALVSSSPLGLPTMWFGLFEWPHIPFLADLPRAEKTVLKPQFFEVHSVLATVLLYVFAVHVLAALKHQFVDRDTVLKRMLPGTKVDS